MPDPYAQRDWLEHIEREMRHEISAQRGKIGEIWALPLIERVRDGHSLGPLKIVRALEKRVVLLPETTGAELAQCQFREGDLVRLSQDNPAETFHRFLFLGEDHDGLHLARWDRNAKWNPPAESGWVVDPDFIDLSGLFGEVIDALASTELGRNRILPLLMGETQPQLDHETYENVLEGFGEPDENSVEWHPSQQDAIASCVAAGDAFLVQGPPGTGKTRVLAEVARRLVERGERLLITGPTHRGIHNALAAANAALPEGVPILKIGPAPLGDAPVKCHDSFAETDLADCPEPYVIGATPYALWSKKRGLRNANFDTILFDEASQITPLLAAMAMLRGEKSLFFGDDRQLPPVVIADTGTPPRLRSVFGVLKNRDFDCLLEETWRLSEPLAAWPSATFYGNRLACRHDRRLHLSPASPLPELAADPALVLRRCGGANHTVRSDEEAQLAADLVRSLVRGGMQPERIGIVTPFRAQAARIRKILSIVPDLPGIHRLVVADTVDRFQGQERDAMILTFASSRPDFILRIADFLFQPERLNVAVTRARLKTIILASDKLLQTAESLADDGHGGAICLSSLIKHIERRG